RDLLTEEYQAIRIDNAQEHQRVIDLVRSMLPTLEPRVKLYSKPFPIFDEYGVQAEIDKALKSKVWLKSGGSIVINQTEALVAIQSAAGFRLRLDHHHQQAGQTKPRARHDRAVPVLLGQRRHQIDLDDLLRDSE